MKGCSKISLTSLLRGNMPELPNVSNARQHWPETIDEWALFINEWSKEKGWVFSLSDTPEKIALMHSELSEALEEYRRKKGFLYHAPSTEIADTAKPEGIAIEMIDCVIRILHYLSAFGYSPQELLILKMEYNAKRPYRHGDKKA